MRMELQFFVFVSDQVIAIYCNKSIAHGFVVQGKAMLFVILLAFVVSLGFVLEMLVRRMEIFLFEIQIVNNSCISLQPEET